MTKIEWCDETWNPITGCSKISEGCQNCYAQRMATRLAGRFGYPKEEPFAPTFHPDRLGEPSQLRKPRRVFVCSMGDLFHESVPYNLVNEVFFTIQNCPQHKFLVLTKRPKRMREYMGRVASCRAWPQNEIVYTNVWLGVTAENQRTADERIPELLNIPAAGHFVSVEPMLGPVDLYRWFPPQCDGHQVGEDEYGHPEIEQCDGYCKPLIDWVICGAETGPGKRPMNLKWAVKLREQCVHAGIPFFGKKFSDGTPMAVREFPAGLTPAGAGKES